MDNWYLHRCPLTTPENWQGLLDVLGKGNYKIIQKRSEDGLVRGKISISPDGAANLRKALEDAKS